MTKVICCKFSPSRWKIGRRSSSRSFSAKVRRASARAISGRWSKQSSANRLREVICDLSCLMNRNVPDWPEILLPRLRDQNDNNQLGGSTMPYYQKLGEIPRKHHIWFHRNGAGPGYKNEGIYYEHVVTTEGFNEAFSIMYHLRPPTRVRHVKLLKCEELKKAADSPLRHHHLRTANLPLRRDRYTGRVPILFNQDMTAWRCRPEKEYGQFQYYKNGGADEIIFVFK